MFKIVHRILKSALNELQFLSYQHHPLFEQPTSLLVPPLIISNNLRLVLLQQMVRSIAVIQLIFVEARADVVGFEAVGF